MFISPRLNSDLRICRRITRKHGTSFFYASVFFPKDLRRATYALYAFFRVLDEIVDNSSMLLSQEALLLHLDKWRAAYWELGSEDPVLEAAVWAMRRCEIPYQYSEDFFKAMLLDTQKNSYRDYSELKSYMYGSASVVGMMMSYLIGFRDQNILKYSAMLGEAMQLTNFLRDIDEDYRLRGRIYMPEDEMREYGISEEDIRLRRFSPRFAEFIKFQVNRAEGLYLQSRQGIGLLHKRGRFPVRVLLAFNNRVLVKIKETRYDVFNKRVRIGKIESSLLILKTALTPRTSR